jgi:hypothetical protein
MWMNEADIEYAAQKLKAEEFLPAVRVLNAFCELINRISDGWAYWSYGTKCSDDLQNIVHWAAIERRRELGMADRDKKKAYTAEDAAKAMKKIGRFLRRCKQTKDNPEVQAWLRVWKEYV